MHEATHGVIASALGKRVEWLRIAERRIPGSHLVQEGGCQLDPDRELDRDDLVWLLGAGMFEGRGIAFDEGAGDHGVWPPLWIGEAGRPILDGVGDRHQLYCLLRVLGSTKEEYDDAIARTRELLAKPELQLWIAKVSAALARDGFLTGAELEALRPSIEVFA
jgi:hypothetical protein